MNETPDMFCFQCEETARGEGCTVKGVCGKPADVANLQDLLIYLLKGISLITTGTAERNTEIDEFVTASLFSTITNANFDRDHFLDKIYEALEIRDALKEAYDIQSEHDAITWTPAGDEDIISKARSIGVLDTENEDIRSLRELITYGVKGIAAYYHHASVLGKQDAAIPAFMQQALAATLQDTSVDELVDLTLQTGDRAVQTMALLDQANTAAYGNPEPTDVALGTRDNPGILISGHDLRDMEDLLKQTADTGIDVYTHGEMLPANAYPAFKKYEHFVGNYGGSWWNQKKEFEAFNGPILMTTNCLVPPNDSYKDRVYTTGVVGYPGLQHIPDRDNGEKDFSMLIEHAKRCQPPEQLEDGEIPVGFAHAAVSGMADRVVEAVKAGKIGSFVVMAGCDGRHASRQYYTEFAEALPDDAVILTAGCAKYRYNKLDLGDIDGIPRVLDAGQCNDSYSLVVIAQKLAEAFDVDDINELPIAFNIAWYEQKAVAVLLALLSLGIKDIMLGPRLPAFVSPAVLDVLVEQFNLQPNSTVEDDMEMLLSTRDDT
ncbi:MAG: hydroxylamine reductase [Thermoplasmatota archaeon]